MEVVSEPSLLSVTAEATRRSSDLYSHMVMCWGLDISFLQLSLMCSY